MNIDNKKDLKVAFEKYICNNCICNNCDNNLLIQTIESKVISTVYSIKCSKYIKPNAKGK